MFSRPDPEEEARRQELFEKFLQKTKHGAKQEAVVTIYIPDIVQQFNTAAFKTVKKTGELPYVERRFEDVTSRRSLSQDDFVTQLDSGPLILVSAESGFGKTTLVRWLLKSWALGNILDTVKLVVLFNCRAFKNGARKSLADFTFCYSSLKGSDTDELTYEQMKKLAGDRQLCICLDGLDELSDVIDEKDEEVRSNVRRAIKSEDSALTGLEFVYGILVGDIFRGCKVLCSGRQNTMNNLSNVLSSDEARSKHKLLALLPFDAKDFEKLISKVDNPIQQFIKEKLKSDQKIRELCTVPFYAVHYVEFLIQHSGTIDSVKIDRLGLMLMILMQGVNHKVVPEEGFLKVCFIGYL